MSLLYTHWLSPFHMFLRPKDMPKTSKIAGTIPFYNERIHPKFYVGMRVYVLFLDSNRNTDYNTPIERQDLIN